MGCPVVGKRVSSSSYGSQKAQIDCLCAQIANEFQWDKKRSLIESLLDAFFEETPSVRYIIFESIFKNDLNIAVFDVVIDKFESEDVKILDLVTLFANHSDSHYSEIIFKVVFALLNRPSVSQRFKECVFAEVTRFQNSIYLAYFYLNCFKVTSSESFLALFKACFDGFDSSFQSYLIKDLLNRDLSASESYLLVPVRYLLWKEDFARIINCEWVLYAIGFTRYDRSIFNREFYVMFMHFSRMAPAEKSPFVNVVYELLAQNVGNMLFSGSLFFSLVLIAGGDDRGLPLFRKFFHNFSSGGMTYFLSGFFIFLLNSELFFKDDSTATNELITFIINEFNFDPNLFHELDIRGKSRMIISLLENAERRDIAALENSILNCNLGLPPQED